jgi:lipid-A-disaccharide synthase
MAEIKRIFIICGEASGELNAANLAEKLLEVNPQIQISGVGGRLLAHAGVNIFSDIKELSVMGFFDVIKKLPRFFALKRLVMEKIKSEKPDAIILVDFSGFNLRLAKEINKRVPVIYYVSPQVWASRPGRVKTIRKYVSKMVVLFKFEEEFYKRHGVNVDFVGHPLLDIVKPQIEKKEFMVRFNLSPTKTTIALLPGSRRSEIEYILPVMLESGSLINRKIKNTQFIIAKSPQVNQEVYNRIILKANLDIKIIEGKTYDCLDVASFALVCSGTATLETAIMQKPFVIVYKMNPLNYFLYRPQVKIPFIGMVNIVAQRMIAPEFIQFNATPNKIAAEALRILSSCDEMERMSLELSHIKSLLGSTGASMRAAKTILDFLNKIN